MKKINITERMLESMRRGFDDPELSASNFWVFETVAVTSLPLNKKGTIFDNTTITEPTLQEMAASVNAQGGFVPIIIQHNLGGGEVTPSGKVFEGAVYPTANGQGYELRVLFAMPNPDTDGNTARAQHTRDINNGLISEVSIGAGFKHLFSASNPTFDWFSEEATLMNFYKRTDDQGNRIDAGETYGIAQGLRSWKELSLVVRGASTGATISSASTQKLSKIYEDGSSMFRKLAASDDFDITELVTFSSSKAEVETTQTTDKGDFDMDANAILAQLSEAGVNLGQVKAELSASQTVVADLTASNTALTTENTELKASTEALTAENTTLKAQIAEAPENSVAELTVVTEFIDANLTAALTAAGKTGVDTKDMTLAAKLELIKEAGVKLHQLHAASGSVESTKTPELAASKLALLNANRGGKK